MNFESAQSSLRLQSLRDALLERYSDEALHQLRVLLRRIRSELRAMDRKKAGALQRKLGALARTTNDARDWDTLVSSAAELLGPEQFSELLPLLDERRERTHDAVYRMLHSKQWVTATASWENYLRKTGSLDHQARAGQETGQVRQRCMTAGRKALAKDRDKRWHKLRIAIKELRYTLEKLEDTQDAATSELLERCKSLQTLLGNWHDTVVHRQLLGELAASGAIEADSPAGGTLDSLRQELALEGEKFLRQVRQDLPNLLQP